MRLKKRKTKVEDNPNPNPDPNPNRNPTPNPNLNLIDYEDVVLPENYYLQPFIWTFMIYGKYCEFHEGDSYDAHAIIDPTATNQETGLPNSQKTQRQAKKREDAANRRNDIPTERGIPRMEELAKPPMKVFFVN